MFREQVIKTFLNAENKTYVTILCLTCITGYEQFLYAIGLAEKAAGASKQNQCKVALKFYSQSPFYSLIYITMTVIEKADYVLDSYEWLRSYSNPQ